APMKGPTQLQAPGQPRVNGAETHTPRWTVGPLTLPEFGGGQTSRSRFLGLPGMAVLALVIVVGFLVLYPLIMLLVGSVTSDSTGAFTLDGYRTALGDSDARRAIFVTLWLSAVRAALGVLVAIFLSWAITRTNVPGR